MDLWFVLGLGWGVEGVALATVIAELENPNAFLWNAMHWGSDRGGWRRDTLYVTDRNKIFALEMGVPGKDQPVDAMPLP